MKAHISHSATAVELVNKKRIEKEVRDFFAELDEYDFESPIHKAQQADEEAEEIALEVMPQNQYEIVYMYGCVHGYISQLIQEEINNRPISIEQAGLIMSIANEVDVEATFDSLIDPEEKISKTLEELYYAGVDAMRGKYPYFMEDVGLYSIRAIVNSGKEIVEKNKADIEKINHWLDEFIRVANEIQDAKLEYNGICLTINANRVSDSLFVDVNNEDGIAPATTTMWGQYCEEYSGRETLMYIFAALMCDLGGNITVEVDEDFDDDMDLEEFLASQSELMRLEFSFGDNETVYTTKMGRTYFGDI